MKRRFVTLATAAALALAAVLAGAPAANANGVTGAPYVALGDSEAAGTGNQPYLDLQCLRSAKAYPELVGSWLGVPAASSACSGASTTAVLGQLGDLGPATQLVTLTAGINNADWQSVLVACSSLGTQDACTAAYAGASAALSSLPNDLGTLLLAVRTAAPNAYIVVTGYPELFGDFTGTCTVGAFKGKRATVTAQQAALANGGIAQVNGAIAQVVTQANFFGDTGIVYADVATAFDGHGLCDSGTRWISGLVNGDVMFARSFHPNAAGQQAYAAAVAAVIPR
ncbi:SGNH/GDSL hydrolase family protein [Microbacterium aureliae]